MASLTPALSLCFLEQLSAARRSLFVNLRSFCRLEFPRNQVHAHPTPRAERDVTGAAWPGAPLIHLAFVGTHPAVPPCPRGAWRR